MPSEIDPPSVECEFCCAAAGDPCKPQCGEDFCEACGDCISCYGGDPCHRNDDGEHQWINPHVERVSAVRKAEEATDAE
jgi:hypothetical protein